LARDAGPIENAEQAGAWLESLINFERRSDVSYSDFRLEAIRALLGRLGDPHESLRVVHVAGSKGKGSTCLIAEAILSGAGRKVGTFTSPHLERWTERFRIGGREVPGEELAAAVRKVRPAVEMLRQAEQGPVPTFFDATTAAALILFRDAGVDPVLLEVGLGGRLDSTNVVTPAVTCVTTIELEHTDKLGDRLELIAAEKAGILKPGVACVSGRLAEEARRVVRARASELSAPLFELGRDFEVESRASGGGRSFRYSEKDGFGVEAEFRVRGRHQLDNAACAIACLRRLPDLADSALAESVRARLPTLGLPGRIELRPGEPAVLIDSAHTAASAEALAAVIDELDAQGVELVLSVSGDKDLDSILAALLPRASRVTLTRADAQRSLDPTQVARAARRAGAESLRVVPNPHLALRAAHQALGAGEILVVAGSVYLAGIARKVLPSAAAGDEVGISRRDS